jgi:hypothetical protein
LSPDRERPWSAAYVRRLHQTAFAVSNEIARRFFPWKGFGDLPGDPLGGWVRGRAAARVQEIPHWMLDAEACRATRMAAKPVAAKLRGQHQHRLRSVNSTYL